MSMDAYWISCTTCGVMFAITDSHEDQLRQSGKGFWCPNGHSLSFGESMAEEIKLLKRQVTRRDERITNCRARIARLTQRTRAYEGASKRRRKLRREAKK